MTNNIISLKSVNFSYGTNLVIDNISLEVESGDFIALVGENGSGKSTLVKLILGLLPNYTGEIKIFGNNQKDFKNEGRIGFVPQNVNLSNGILPVTVGEVIELGFIKSSIEKTERKKKMENILKEFELENLKSKMISELSGGQLQRVFLAKALVTTPKLLILDEPSSALDSESKNDFYKYLKQINIEKNVAIILITHDSGNVGSFVNKLMYIDRKLIFYGKLKEFCLSNEMAKKVGLGAQHMICHQHEKI